MFLLFCPAPGGFSGSVSGSAAALKRRRADTAAVREPLRLHLQAPSEHPPVCLFTIHHPSLPPHPRASVPLTDRRSGVLSPVYTAVMSPPAGFGGGGSGRLSIAAPLQRSGPLARAAVVAVSRCGSPILHSNNGDGEEKTIKSSIG